MKRMLTLAALLTSSGLACGYIPQDLYQWTDHYARAFGLDPLLVTSVIWVESRYCVSAHSPAGAIGLGQIMPALARENRIDPWDPQSNIYMTAKYLRSRYLTHQDWSLALAAYNAGSGAVLRYGGIPPYKETQQYVSKVLGTYQALKEKYPEGLFPVTP